MNNNKSNIIGWVLIFLVMVGFFFVNKPSESQLAEQAKIKAYQDSVLTAQRQLEAAESQKESNYGQQILTDSTSALYQAVQGKEKQQVLENDLLKIVFSNKGGCIASVTLKDYLNQQGTPVVLFDKQDEGINFMLDGKNENILTKDLYFQPITVTDSTLVYRLQTQGAGYLDFSYQLLPNSYMVNFSVQAVNMQNFFSSSMESMSIDWEQKIRQQEKGYSFEQRYATLTYKEKAGDTDHLSEAKDQKKEMSSLDWVAFKDQFFSCIFIADHDFTKANLSSSTLAEGSGFLKEMQAKLTTPFDPSGAKASNFQFYFGPNHFKTLQASNKLATSDKDLKLHKLIYMGWPVVRLVNRYFIIYLFDWLSQGGLNMGLVLLLLTLIVKLIVFPFTYKQYISTAKMRALKPHIDEINKKYPKSEDAMQKQQETMTLYSKYGVSPMGGCLPSLIQMPIWMALFFFVPNAIELRQQKFLWANDLSAYDDVLSWGSSIPLLGNHLSLFCLLFSIVNILSTVYTMKQQPAGQEQQMKAMKWMMYLMPFFFIFVLNGYSSGLNYYYFVSGLITIITMIVLRKTINENKLLAQLEANYEKNKANPVKKSNMMARLEAMQKEQERLAKEQQKHTQKK